MPFRVRADGTIVGAVDEAIALQERLLGKKAAPSANGEKRKPVAPHRPTPANSTKPPASVTTMACLLLCGNTNNRACCWGAGTASRRTGYVGHAGDGQ